jgi:hypothetical protein
MAKRSRKLVNLKKKAKMLYAQYVAVAADYNCGRDLLDYVSPIALRTKNEFNAVMDEIAKIDPSTPAIRL